MFLKLCKLKNMRAFYFMEKEMDFQPCQLARGSVQTKRVWRESWEVWQKNCQPVQRIPLAAGSWLWSAPCVSLPLWKKIPPFPCINIVLINLNSVTLESSFDGQRKRCFSLFNLLSECCCGGFLHLLSPLWQLQLYTGKCLVQQCAWSLFSFEVTAVISSVSNC